MTMRPRAPRSAPPSTFVPPSTSAPRSFPTRVVALAILALAALTGAAAAHAAAPDPAVIATITGLEPEVKDGVATVRLPRSDLAVAVDGVALTPFQGLTSWAAFAPAGDQVMVMGDLTLTEREVNPTLSAALESGLAVTALHNHFFYDRPRVFFMHIGGMGTLEQLATGVANALAAAKQAASAPEGFGGPRIAATSTIDAKPLEAILGVPAQVKDGMAKFVFAKRTAMHGTDAGAALGVNTWAAFAGTQSAAAVDGDFAMLEGELQAVLRALRHADINVVAIHNHMTDEQPRIMFLHFWGKGAADALARGIKAALDTQAR